MGLAILALAVVVLGAAYVNTMNAHATAAGPAEPGWNLVYLRAAVLAEPELRKVEQGGRLVLPADRILEWEATVTAAAVPDLFRVVVRGRVSGPGGDGEQTFERALMLWRPGWSEPGERERLRAAWVRVREEVAR